MLMGKGGAWRAAEPATMARAGALMGGMIPDADQAPGFQPLRDQEGTHLCLGWAVGAADSLKTFMETPLTQVERGDKKR